MNVNNNMNFEPDEKSDRVGRAWERLRGRLEKDALLTDTDGERVPIFRNRKFNHSYFGRLNEYKLRRRFASAGIAASFLVLLVASVFVFKAVFSFKTERVILENSEANSTYVTTLEDGSTVYLAQKTSLSKPKHFGKLRRETKLEGDAFFEIARNFSRPFVIETALAKIEVLGTSFSVNENMVSVKTGKVRVWLKNGGESVTLLAGESAFFEPGRLQTINSVNSDSLFTRYTQKMHFKDEKLSNVVRIINKYSLSNVNKLALDSDLNNRLITATFSKESDESYAKLICIALDLKYEKTDGRIRIFQ